jgi:hypothetical protein
MRHALMQRIREDLAQRAEQQVGILLRRGEIHGACRMMDGIAMDYNQIIEMTRSQPGLIPIEYMKLDGHCIELLCNYGYSTAGEVAAEFPHKTLTIPGIDIHYHHMIWVALQELKLEPRKYKHQD